MLVSTELEMPVVGLPDGRPAPQSVFTALWQRLQADDASWRPSDHGVVRDYPHAVPCINPLQAIMTDTGPTLEMVTSPSHNISRLAIQLRGLQDEVKGILDEMGYCLLGCAVHPRLKATPADYFRYRTPRRAYDYAIDERGWNHWSIVSIASVQEVVDVPFKDAVQAVRMLQRLSGLMNFVLRNDPDFHGDAGGALSVRPGHWKNHVPQSGAFATDAQKVCLPSREFSGWRDYLSLLWEHSSMFLIGTKDRGMAYLPEHPSFIRFLGDAPDDGWPARTLAGEDFRLTPEIEHIQHSDWTYMGFARIRWKWREGGSTVAEVMDAWQHDRIEELMAENLERVVVENRCNSTQKPGENLVPLALVSGLLANLDEAMDFALTESYTFWVSVLDASTIQPLDSSVRGRRIPGLARDMVDIARRGLVKRGDEEVDVALSVLYRRIEEKLSPSERLLREFRKGGIERVVEYSRL